VHNATNGWQVVQDWRGFWPNQPKYFSRLVICQYAALHWQSYQQVAYGIGAANQESHEI
jgi:hypothetical protein